MQLRTDKWINKQQLDGAQVVGRDTKPMRVQWSGSLENSPLQLNKVSHNNYDQLYPCL